MGGAWGHDGQYAQTPGTSFVMILSGCLEAREGESVRKKRIAFRATEKDAPIRHEAFAVPAWLGMVAAVSTAFRATVYVRFAREGEVPAARGAEEAQNAVAGGRGM